MKIFYETRVLSYINTLVAYPIKIVILLIDLLLVGYLIYKLIKIVKDTRAMQLIKGIAMLIFITALSDFLSLNILNYILNSIMTYGVLLIIVVFQPELRKALENIGKTKFKNFLDFEDETSCIGDVVSAVMKLAKEKIGALIVFERETSLSELAHTGISLDSKVSEELLINIFIPDTPLHDGAVIIKNNKIVAASCILPLTDNEALDRDFGTRHRAAIGVSEQSDCIVVVASEETGIISIAINGKIVRNLTEDQLKKELTRRLERPKKPTYIKRK
jgi:diadenylate cyclase